MEGGCPESAELKGRTCDICQVECNERVCPTCTQVLDSLDSKQQYSDYGESLFPVICSLQMWSREIPTWNIIDGLLNLIEAICQKMYSIAKPSKGTVHCLRGS